MAKIFTQGSKLYLDYRVNGKRIRKGTGLEDTKENRKKLEKDVIPALMMKIKLGDFVKPETKKFSYYFSAFLLEHEQDKSFHNRIYIYRKVNNHFGRFNVADINRKMIKDYLASLDLRNSTKKDYLNCVKGVLDIALDDEVIERNIAVNITFKREEKADISPFSKSEIELLLSKSNGMLRNFLGISLYTGMRSGEVLGLMHSDISDDKISIKRSISKGRVTTPKTIGSIRDIPMFDDVKQFIDNQRQLSESLYLFDYNKHFIKDVSYFKRRWSKLIIDCGIEYRKMYNTRHSFITAMLNSGNFKILDIAAIVGHTSSEMIIKNYAGFIKDEHLKINTNIAIFGHSLDIVDKNEIEKEA